MVRSSCKCRRLSRFEGAMSRFLSMMTSAVPPEIIFVSAGSAARSETASSSDFGCKNLMFGMIVGLISFLSATLHLATFLLIQRAQYLLGRNRQVEKIGPYPAGECIYETR